MPNLPGFHPDLAQRPTPRLPSLHRDTAPYDPTAVPSARAALALTSAGHPPVSEAKEPSTTYEQLFMGMGPESNRPDTPTTYEALFGAQNPELVTQSKATLDDALRAQRMEAIGEHHTLPHGPGNIKKRTDVLSWDEYNELTNKQRAAVDFNTMLVRAVRKDRNHQDEYQPTQVEKLTYDNSVEKMFGDGRGSDTYAPETMAVLRQIGYKDDQADLDDFLGLKAAIKTKDLDNLEINFDQAMSSATAAEGGNPVRSERINLSTTLASATQQMEHTLAKGDQLLGAQSIFQGAALERGDDTDFLGGIRYDPTEHKPMPGYGTDEVSQYFQQAFGILADPKNSKDRDQILATMNGELSPSEFNAFMAYADQRSRMSEQYKMPLGQDQKAEYKTPEQFRKLLGLGE